ncbi:hypothetical protein [Lusitaniella coriacea]|uniref:hypothetical protein n=1 Tax=Lusitaniella coriacea TaxID=1983105 RepID=UPI003CEC7F2F
MYTPSPGSQHSSIEEAIEAAEEDGTQSILDIFYVSDLPYEQALASLKQNRFELSFTTFPLPRDELIRLFNTDKPTHEMVEKGIVQDNEGVEEFWESIWRGTARHIIIYENNEPVEVFFIGYSFD